MDFLTKMLSNEEATKRFVDFLIDYWNNDVRPLRTDTERASLLNVDMLLQEVGTEVKKYIELSNKGEHSVKFLLLIAKLLRILEKTNREDAYMFGRVLESLKESKDISSIVSSATYRQP